MKFLLFFAYYLEGFLMAIAACSALGLVFAVFIALAKSRSRPRNLLFALGYGAGAVICYELFIGGFYLAGWIGERTHYVGQYGIIVGGVFPGVISLKIIPQYWRIASLQTSGIHVE